MQNFKTQLLASLNDRKAHERAKNALNESMQSTIDAMIKIASHDSVAQIMFASNMSADFINKSERTNARFNVYAAEKDFNIARALAKACTLNHYTKAILLAASKLALNDLTLTHADAVYACSMSAKHKDHSRSKIIASAQYKKHVALNTASTQSSSSINALQAFNVLHESRDSANHVCYTLTDTDATRDLIALAAQ